MGFGTNEFKLKYKEFFDPPARREFLNHSAMEDRHKIINIDALLDAGLFDNNGELKKTSENQPHVLQRIDIGSLYPGTLLMYRLNSQPGIPEYYVRRVPHFDLEMYHQPTKATALCFSDTDTVIGILRYVEEGKWGTNRTASIVREKKRQDWPEKRTRN